MGTYQVVRSKMAKTRVLLADAKLARYVPHTTLYTAENLADLLHAFQKVYVKPDCGRGGQRVVSIELGEGGGCRVHYKTTVTEEDTIAAAAAFVDRIARGDRFIIQQGIALRCIGGVPFDLRVNVQKPYTRWEVTAMVARVAAPGKAVSNYCQGATLVELNQALRRSGLGTARAKKVRETLVELGQRTAAALTRKYGGLRELGLDVGLDCQAKPWILEVNTKPRYPRGLSRTFDRCHRIILQGGGR